MKRAGGAVIVGPHFLHLELLPQQHGLHHGSLVGAAPVERVDARHGGGAQIHHGLLKRRAAAAGQHVNRVGGARCSPINIVARQVVPVVERAGVFVIAGRTHAGIEFDVAAVGKRRQRLVRLGIERDLDAGVRFEFEQKPLALAGKSRRLDYAAAQNHHFAAGDVQLRRRPGPMRQPRERTTRDEAQQAADAGQHARAPQNGGDAERQKGGDDQDQLVSAEGDESGSQNPGGNRGHRS